MSLKENLGADLGFDLGLAAAPAPQNGLDGTADFFVRLSTLNVFKTLDLSSQRRFKCPRLAAPCLFPLFQSLISMTHV